MAAIKEILKVTSGGVRMAERRTFEVYFKDLKEEVQKELLEFLGIESPEEENLDVVPLCVLERE